MAPAIAMAMGTELVTLLDRGREGSVIKAQEGICLCACMNETLGGA